MNDDIPTYSKIGTLKYTRNELVDQLQYKEKLIIHGKMGLLREDHDLENVVYDALIGRITICKGGWRGLDATEGET